MPRDFRDAYKNLPQHSLNVPGEQVLSCPTHSDLAQECYTEHKAKRQNSREWEGWLVMWLGI